MSSAVAVALTELGLLRRLEPRASVRCRVFHGLAGVNFHPKVYLVDQRRDVE